MSTSHLHAPDSPPSTPPPPEWPPGATRPSWRVWAALTSVGLLISTLVGAAFLPIPYVTVRPGSVRPVAGHVLVEGTDSYPPEQSIAFTTVSTGGATLLEAVVGWLDDDVDVLPDERFRGDRSPDENRRYNAQLMDTSKAVAITVALGHLGYDVSIRTNGTVVRQILEDSPAEEVLELDDVIVAVDGDAVDEPGEVGDLLQSGGPGASHLLTVERPAGGDQRVQVRVTTIADADDPDRALIGIATEDRITGFDHPVDVFIDSGTVGGPSAGLAFTLGVIDVLTPGELTGGRRVAVTGTMALDGTVGPVGGAAQKAVTVRDAGYDVFVVPQEMLEVVTATVGDDLEVFGVETLSDALDVLDSLGGAVGPLAAAGASST